MLRWKSKLRRLKILKRKNIEEKWAYEAGEALDEAGMSAECLEECDDLILWFSEGKYVYQAMELKMKYKPLTPLQKEKYENRILEEEEPEPVTDETPEDTEENTEESAKESAEEVKEEPEDLGKTRVFSVKQSDKTGAETDETLRISGQMKIEEILQEWEEKQKANAEAIADQKKKDEEVLLERRRAEEKRKEEEARRLEEQQRAAEEARKIAEQKVAEEARRLEEQKAAEEARKIAEQKPLMKHTGLQSRKQEGLWRRGQRKR